MELSYNLSFFVPTRLYASGLDTKSNSAGNYTVQTQLRDIVDVLRAKLKTVRLGANFLEGLRDNIGFPVQASGSVASWTSENTGADASDSDSSFGLRWMNPKSLFVTSSYSKQLLEQSSIGVENWVRNDSAKAVAVAIEAAALVGSGTSGQPVGIANVNGIGSVVGGTNGAVITHANCVDLQDKVFNASGDQELMGYVTTPGIRTKLLKTGVLDSSTAGSPVWTIGPDGNGMIAGCRAEATAAAPSTLVKGSASNCHLAIFSGDWSSLVVGLWGDALELTTVDPFRLKKQGLVEISTLALADVLVLQPGSFAAAKDMLIA